MKFFIWLAAIPLLLLLACSPEKKSDPSDHLLKDHKLALDKAKEVDRLADEAAERQRRALQENK